MTLGNAMCQHRIVSSKFSDLMKANLNVVTMRETLDNGKLIVESCLASFLLSIAGLQDSSGWSNRCIFFARLDEPRYGRVCLYFAGVATTKTAKPTRSLAKQWSEQWQNC